MRIFGFDFPLYGLKVYNNNSKSLDVGRTAQF